jgi:hypothetical protein
MRFDSQASPTVPASGPARVLASRSATRARGSEHATLDIFGRHGSSSSASADLQRSLESKLRASSAFSGSILFELTWNDAVTPSGHRICALRASARRTSGSGCTSWPSPIVNDSKSSDYAYSQGDHDRVVLKLGGAARLMGDAGGARSGRHGGAVSDAKAQGEGERAWYRRLLDESRLAGVDRRCTNCGAVHRIGTQCGRVGDATLDEFSRSARCRELAGEEAEGEAGVEGSNRAEHAGAADSVADRNGARCARADEGTECAGGDDAGADRRTGFWSPVEWRPCTDGKARPTEPRLEPLAHGVSGRMVVRRTVESAESSHEEEHWYNRCGALVGFGNAIVPQVAAAFIEAALDTIEED